MSDFIVKEGLVANGSIKGNTGTVTGNATLDLSTGDAFEVTPTADVTFAFSNPPVAGNAQAFSVALTGVLIDNAYDLANASYDSVSFSVAAQETNSRGLSFKADGTKMYVLGATGIDINEYNLSTAWDVSTASYLQNFSVASQEVSPTDLFFKPDGTKVYVVGSSGDAVNEYGLSTAWDISTASYVQNFSVAAEEAEVAGLFFKPDGTKMYITGSGGQDINEYSLSTAWDISTASYVQRFFSGVQEALPTGISFKSDGTKMYLVGVFGDDVNEYNLSTAWDISTASYVRVFSFASEETTAHGLFFGDNGTKLYIVGTGSNAVHQYSTGTFGPTTITYPASVQWSGGTAPTAPANGETDLLTFYTEDGGTTYYGFKVGDALA